MIGHRKEKIKKRLVLDNKGTGGGGLNTNKNGLSYEILTDLDDRLSVISTFNHAMKIKFNNHENVFVKTKQSHLFKYMSNDLDKSIEKSHGCKNPDECYIDHTTNTMFIIEKKFQQCSGSVCEKIQSVPFKLWQYKRTFPKYDIVYIYCLSEWFKHNCKAEI